MKKYILLFAILGVLLGSCEDNLNINQSPNNPATATPELVLPVAQTSIAYMNNLDLGIMAGYLAQYWTQAIEASQYSAYDRYNYTGSNTQTAWLHAYAWALKDLVFIRNSSLESGDFNYTGISELLTAYTYQVVVDFWDVVPFNDALGGEEGTISPTYDNGQEVYDSLIVIIDRGLGYINPTAETPGADDFIFEGDMDLWIKFANTLKLKIYLRQIEARPQVATQGIQQLYADNALFLAVGEDAFVPFPGTGGFDGNPLWSGDQATVGTGLGARNINGSSSIIENGFNATGDPRVDFYFDPAASGPNEGFQLGLLQGVGANAAGSDDIDFNSVPSTVNLVGPASPVWFMTAFESLLLQAEAAARGITSEDPKALYDAAVAEAFAFAGYSGQDAPFTGAGGAYEYPASTLSDNLKAIAYQKWLALCGVNNVEGWTEFRRFDWPDLDQSIAGTGASLNGSKFPRRAIYPTSEVSTNPNTPPVANIGDPVWWDVDEDPNN